nr:IS66 family insertion sequence element accessory protein TnpB [Bradyrhizobium oropedii]
MRSDLKVVLAAQPVDFRKSVHTLSALVSEALRANPYCGDVFVFRSKRMDRAKLLAWDGSGMVLVTKWLHQGRFTWLPTRDGIVHLSATQLAMMLDYPCECALLPIEAGGGHQFAAIFAVALRHNDISNTLSTAPIGSRRCTGVTPAATSMRIPGARVSMPRCSADCRRARHCWTLAHCLIKNVTGELTVRIGAAIPNRIGVADGRMDQHGCSARTHGGGGRALSISGAGR